jgi:hypothetical protein
MANPNRKENYKKLRAVGYGYQEAARLKDLSQNRVDAIIQSRTFKIGDVVTTPMLDGLQGKVIKVYGNIIKVAFLSDKTVIDLKADIKQFEKVGE